MRSITYLVLILPGLLFPLYAIADEQLSDSFFQAAHQGDIAGMQRLIRQGADVNESDFNGETAIFYAVRGNQLNALKFLVQIQAKLNHLNKNGGSVLDLALIFNFQDIFRYLVEQDIRVDSALQSHKTTPLLCTFFAHAHLYPEAVQMTKKLLQKGAVLNLSSEHRDIPIIDAVYYLKDEPVVPILKLLLEHKAQINIVNRDGETALTNAIKYTRPSAAEFLLQNGADVNDRFGLPLRKALDHDYSYPLLELLIKYNAKLDLQNPLAGGDTPLHLAVAQRNLKAIQLLLKNGAKTDIKNNAGENCFYSLYYPEKDQASNLEYRSFVSDAKEYLKNIGYANTLETEIHQVLTQEKNRADWEKQHELSEKTRNTLFEAVVQEDLTKIKTLLKAGARLNQPATLEHQYTALHYAVKYASLEMVEFLLQHKAPLNIGCAGGQTPLILSLRRNNALITEYLLKMGANPSLTDKSGKSAAHYAVLSNHIENLILLNQRKLDWNKADQNGATPFLLASASSTTEILTWLLAHSANSKIRDFSGNCALHYAIQTDHLENFKFLLASGASLYEKNQQGFSPVFFAHNDFPDGRIASYLISLGHLPSPDTLPQKKLAQAKQDRFNFIFYGVILPSLYLGASIYLREKTFSDHPTKNPLGYINGIGSGIIAGGFLGMLLTRDLPTSGSGMGAAFEAIGNVMTGIAVGSVLGGALTAFFSKKFADNRGLYYTSTGILVLVPLIQLSW